MNASATATHIRGELATLSYEVDEAQWPPVFYDNLIWFMFTYALRHLSLGYSVLPDREKLTVDVAISLNRSG